MSYQTDVLFLAATVALLALYQLYLRMRLRGNPYYTVQAVNHAARRAWVESIMGADERAILGVQTLRNSTMASTFFASTAVLLVMGTLTLSGQSEKLTTSWHQLNALGSAHPGLWTAKVLCLLSAFLVAFFAFSMAVRLFNHVGYQLTVPTRLRPASVTPASVAVHLNRAGHYYSIGMRAYYFAVPLVFWLFGPHFMFSATCVLVFVLYYIDRAPSQPAMPGAPGETP